MYVYHVYIVILLNMRVRKRQIFCITVKTTFFYYCSGIQKKKSSKNKDESLFC